MQQKIVLLLNLSVLVVNFFVALGATNAQARVLRTTARVAYAQPVVAPRARAEVPTRVVVRPTARLVKFLGRVREVDRLTTEQVAALCAAHDFCRGELEEGGLRLREADHDGALVRRLVGDLRARCRRHVEERLRAAQVPEGEVMARLVRVVMASAG